MNESFREQMQRGSWDGLMIQKAWVEIVERLARARVLRRWYLGSRAEQAYEDLFLFKCSGVYLKYRIC